VEAVLRSGVRRVVAAIADPNLRVAGEGLARLRAAGLAVEVGLLEAEARRLNEAWLKWVARGLPWVTLKMAVTLDGRIAAATGDSRWITSEAARRYAHRLRDRHDAVLVGAATVRADDPLLTARVRGARNPLRVVLGARAELPLTSQIARTAGEVPTLLACGVDAPAGRVAALEGVGIEALRLPLVEGRIDLRALAEALAARGVVSVLLEGGAETAAGFLDAGLVDRVEFLYAPKIIGGRAAPGPVGGAGRGRMAEALPVRDVRIRRLGSDWLVGGYL
jgi:diaminohydroxyphosphoribosylaminopyrimidine deaminase/5-amino-6-(5-phosphoribosylamino)uracil reductase